MIHDFLLLPSTDVDRGVQYQEHFHSTEALHLHDDIVMYMHDSLRPIASANPSNPAEWEGFGLNLYGPTAIESEGALKLAAVLRGWATLFALGNPTLELTGGFTWNEGEPPESGSYERLEFNRDELVMNLNAIAEMASGADGTKRWLLHLGI